jgi:hypothetical protein
MPRRRREPVDLATAPLEGPDGASPEPAGDAAPAPPAKRAESAEERIRRLRAELADHGQEWRELIRDGPPVPPRAYELRRMMNVKSRIISELEPEVTVDVPVPAVGRCFLVGEREFHPGVHTVKASVAEYLAWMIDRDQIAEVRRNNDLSNQRKLDPHGLRGLLEGRQSEKFLGDLGR